MILKLKKIWSYGSYKSAGDFKEWAKRTNNIEVVLGNHYKVVIQRKVGKKKKIQNAVVHYYNDGCGHPECCGHMPAISIEFADNSHKKWYTYGPVHRKDGPAIDVLDTH